MSGPFRHLVEPEDVQEEKKMDKGKEKKSDGKEKDIVEPEIKTLATSGSHGYEHEQRSEPVPAPRLEPTIQPRYHKSSETFSADRGRLFVRVLSLDNVQTLPNIETKHAKVCMILDNGVHSITTPYNPMNNRGSTPLNHEFELVVGKTLEFILTFRAKWLKPRDSLLARAQQQYHNQPLLAPPLNPNAAAHMSGLRAPGTRMASNATTGSSASSYLKPTQSTASSAVSSRKRRGFAKLFSRNKDKKNAAATAQQGMNPAVQKGTSTSLLAPPTPVQASSSRFGTGPRQGTPSRLGQTGLQNAAQPAVEPKVADPWERYVAQDGSFARAYVTLSQYESEVYGVAKQVTITCYNEWTEASDDKTSSTAAEASSATTTGSKSMLLSSEKTTSATSSPKVQQTPVDPLSKRQAPYPIATLTCELMYVPRGRADEELPGSIHDAKHQLAALRNQIAADKEAQIEAQHAVEEQARRKQELAQQQKENEAQGVICAGSLSQLGGDCQYWRRRHFKLNEVTQTLTAYNENSHKPRVSINLRKAVRVVEEKKSLVELDEEEEEKQAIFEKKKGKSRRKSAFAEQEEAFMFVNEGFRIRFANGEIIDFYGDSQEQKREWVKGLRRVISEARVRDIKEKEEKKAEEEALALASGKKKVVKQDDKNRVEMKPWMEEVLAYEEEQEYPEIREWREAIEKKKREEREKSQEEAEEEVKEEGDVQEEIEMGYREEQLQSEEMEEEGVANEESLRESGGDIVEEDPEYAQIPVAGVRNAKPRDSTATTMNDFIEGIPLVLPKRNHGTNTMYI